MASTPNPLPSNIDLHKLVDDYAKQLAVDDSAIGQQMQSQVVRVIFEILINLAYVLFGLGVALGLKGGITDLQRMGDYISTPSHQALLCMIALIALTIFSISQVFSKSITLSTRAKRDLDLAVDCLRVVVYIFTGIFFGPYVYSDPQSTTLILSFWAFVLAATLFLVRKIVKWYVFLFKEPDNMKPWENFTVTSPLALLQFAQLQQFLAQKMKEQQVQAAKQAKVPAEPAKQNPQLPVNTASQFPSNLTNFDLDERLNGTRKGLNSNDQQEIGHPLQ